MMRRIAIFAFVLSLSVFLISVYNYNLTKEPLETLKVYAHVNVTDKAAFDLNSTALTFGKVLAGGSSSRSIILKNNYNHSVKLEINSEGSINQVLIFEKKLDIPSGETVRVHFSILTDQNTQNKDYEGYVFFKIYAVDESI